MKIYVAGAKRSAVGSFMGSFTNVHPADLGAAVVRDLIETTGAPADKLDEVIVGNVLSAGNGQGVGRQVAIKAGVPKEVPAYSINMVCGSAMKAVMNAVSAIKAGDAEMIIAGGVECMSNAPYLTPKNTRGGLRMGDFKMVDHMVFDALTDAYSGVHMGITAENIAEKYGITREMQDQLSLDSQRKAIAAVDGGLFKNEIVPVKAKIGKEEKIIDTDEHPNRTTNPEKMAKLRTAFKQGGTVTAGNASGINDGAAFVLVASEEAVKKYNLKPLFEIVSVGQGGVDPQYMGLGPVPAIKNALGKTEYKLQDMEVVELNEVFAAQAWGVVTELSEFYGMTREQILEKTNPRGGAIALGHPVGASGCRILVTLVHEMLDNNYNLGLASLCIGGGMGTAIVLKKA